MEGESRASVLEGIHRMVVRENPLLARMRLEHAIADYRLFEKGAVPVVIRDGDQAFALVAGRLVAGGAVSFYELVTLAEAVNRASAYAHFSNGLTPPFEIRTIPVAPARRSTTSDPNQLEGLSAEQGRRQYRRRGRTSS